MSASEDKLTHLEHAEDHVINAGARGYEHARDTLHASHDALLGNDTHASVSTKYDGSPSIVFGHHPETGKFFVASKSAFNKTPKINYSEKDIDDNHGHAPGLAQKLKTALTHLPKSSPKKGVFQGDIMHSGVAGEDNPHGDVAIHDGQAHFTPNTITYSTKKEGEAAQVAKSKIGVAVHTSYNGPSFEQMKATYNSGSKGFKKHSDVHLLDVTNPGSSIDPERSKGFAEHMVEAEKYHQRLVGGDGYSAGERHTDHLKTYINKTVRTGEKPSVGGFKQHLTDFHTKAAEKFKTAARKQQAQQDLSDAHEHVDAHHSHMENLLNVHRHLQAAKDHLVHAFSANPNYDHHVGGKRVKPEGHVVVINNRPTKLVDRAEFSRLNFEKNTK
jgi:hypothetical protein